MGHHCSDCLVVGHICLYTIGGRRGRDRIQSVPITTKVVILNPAYSRLVYSIQDHVINFPITCTTLVKFLSSFIQRTAKTWACINGL